MCTRRRHKGYEQEAQFLLLRSLQGTKDTHCKETNPHNFRYLWWVRVGTADFDEAVGEIPPGTVTVRSSGEFYQNPGSSSNHLAPATSYLHKLNLAGTSPTEASQYHREITSHVQMGLSLEPWTPKVLLCPLQGNQARRCGLFSSSTPIPRIMPSKVGQTSVVTDSQRERGWG